jgi:hypothetical protein
LVLEKTSQQEEGTRSAIQWYRAMRSPQGAGGYRDSTLGDVEVNVENGEIPTANALSVPGPILPTLALQQVGSFLGYTGCDANVVATPAHDPQETQRGKISD